MKTIDVLLEELQLSLEVVSTRARITPERVVAIIDGRWTPSPEERRRLATALGVAVDDISWGHTMAPRNVRYHQFGLKEVF
ncbi:MAG: helix-turn-helix transcriptional regulator [Planctomycetes bacterium]|nr:helix-turn-helix transcriptional regulator [Planctomycetota bacterium]